MNTIRLITGLVASFFIFAAAQTSSAAVFTVTNTNDSGAGSLRQAILDSNVNNADDTINFDATVFGVSRQILLTSGELVITADNAGGTVRTLTLNGTGANLLEINGNDHSRIFRIGFQAKVVIDKVKLSGGNGTSNGELPDMNSSGGAIFLDGGASTEYFNLTLTNAIVSGNRSTHNNASAGAINIFGRMLIVNSAIINNTGRYYGAITIPNSELRMYNSTISYNTGSLVGGVSQQAGTFYLTNSTVSQNIATIATGAPAIGGLLLSDLGPNSHPNFYPRNSIVANNRAVLPPVYDVHGAVKSRGNNIFANTLATNFQEASPTDLLNVDPLIDFGLATNGGVIPHHALAAGSPAIDSGNNCVLITIVAAGGCSDIELTFDIRGVTRPQDANSDGSAIVDRGPFEATAAEVNGAPGAPDLDAADDSGVSNTDNITNTPQVTLQVGNLTAGATVQLYRNGVLVSSTTAAGTTVSLEDNLTAAGSYVYTARQVIGGVSSLQGGALTVVFDNIAPVGSINQAVGQADPTRLQPINFTLTFGEAVIGFTSADLTFASSTANTSGAVVEVTGASPSYGLSVSNVTSDGTVVLGVVNGAVQDIAGNSSGTITGTDNSVTLDTTPPTVTINQAASQADPTRFLPVNFTVTFSEPIVNFTGTDISLVGSTANVASATRAITGTGPTYNVAISNVTSNGGTIVASIPALAVQDLAGNTSAASTSVDNTVVLDNVLPSVTVNQAIGQSDPTNVLPINYTVTFNEAVTGFDAADILFTGSTFNTAGATVTVTGTGPTYNVAIGNITANGGTLRISVRSGAATDVAGNSSLASSSVDNSVALDNVSPGVTVNQAIAQPDPTTTQPIIFNALFSEAVTGFTAADVSLAGSTANVSFANIQITGSGVSYAILIRGVTSSGQVRVTIPAGVAVDAIGNANLASTSTDNTVTITVKPTLFDFDGDLKADIGIFRPNGPASEWWINRSGNGQTFALQFGASTDKITPADYTGDGKADIAFFRPASGEWYVLRSEDFSFFALPFGANGDVPVPADYDADGKADFAVFRPSSSTWFLSQSSGAPTQIVQFGITGDQPVPADYDGDGKADVGIFRPAASGGEWWINRSTAGSLAMQFGAATDKAVQGDYTGDGKADIAIWRPATGEWYIVRSEDSSFYGFPFGANGDTVAPADYDGDGKFDPTVFRPSSATWFIARTTSGTQIVQFGATGDQPVANSFVP